MSIPPESDRARAIGFAGLVAMVSDVDAMLAALLDRSASLAAATGSESGGATPLAPTATATVPEPRASSIPAPTRTGLKWPWVLGAAIICGLLWIAVRSESMPAPSAFSDYSPAAETPAPIPAPERPRPTLTGSHTMSVSLAGTMHNHGDDAPMALKCWGSYPMRVTSAGADLRGVIGPSQLTCQVSGETFPVDWNQDFEGSEIDMKVNFSDGPCEYSGKATGGIVRCSETDTAYAVSMSGTWQIELESTPVGAVTKDCPNGCEDSGATAVPSGFAGEWTMALNLTGEGADADGTTYPASCSGTAKVSITQAGEVLRGTTGDGDVSCAMAGRGFTTSWASTLTGSRRGTGAFFSAEKCDYSGQPSGGTVTCQYSSTESDFSVVMKGTWRRVEGG